MRCPVFFSLLLLLALPAVGQDELGWLTTDFTSGGMVRQQASECAATELSTQVAGDAVVRSQNGYVFVLNRYGYDNVTVFAASDPESPLMQFSTGNGSNPQDIFVVEGSKAYVAALQLAHVLIVDFMTGQITGQIDLSQFADTADGIPEAAALIPAGDHILVMCQRLDQTTAYWDPAGPGCLVMIDPETDAVVDANPTIPEVDPVWLPCGNPTAWARTPTSLLIACVGYWSLYDDGGLVGVDPSGAAAPSIVVAETDANGNIFEVAATGAAAHVAVSYADWSYAVAPYRSDPGTLGQALSGLSGGYIPDMLAHQGVLYVADQGSFSAPELAGLYLFDADTDSLICGPVPTGLPPSSGAIVEPLDSTMTSLPDEVLTLVRLSPNPARHSVALTRLVHGLDALRVALYDMNGRALVRMNLSGSPSVLPLNDAAGRTFPAGSYILRVTGAGRVEDHQLVIR